jgi:hypothetical protein
LRVFCAGGCRQLLHAGSGGGRALMPHRLGAAASRNAHGNCDSPTAAELPPASPAQPGTSLRTL